MRVEVALRANKVYTALVVALHNRRPEGYEVKLIRSIVDKTPIVNKRQIRFWSWVAKYYLASPGEVMQCALPAHLKIQSETRLLWTGLVEDPEAWTEEGYLAFEALQVKKELAISELRALVSARHLVAVLHELLERGAALVDESLKSSYKPRIEKIVSLGADYEPEDARKALFDQLSRAPKQLQILLAYMQLYAQQGQVRQPALLEKSGASPASLKALVDKGIFDIEEIPVDRLARNTTGTLKDITFTPAQQQAYADLEAGLAQKPIALLHGVTGSGKTLLYIRKIREVLAQGKQAILLLPEIGLTTQLVSRLYAYFGEELGVYHSRFSDNERVEIWDKVLNGTYRIVVGPRSALWLPYHNLGLIIADEEHDPSYKQRDPSPRFHARDAAIYLATLHDAQVILGSATPSVESLYHAQIGKYGYAALTERYLGVKMPVIEVIDAKSIDQLRPQGIDLLTPELIAAITDALGRRKQVILFQNRRGYAPFLICVACGFVPHCRNCSVSLTYHKSTDKMHCHYCGLKVPVIHSCPQCGSDKIRSKSFGTEKIEEEVQRVFPQARVARMDVDSTRAKNSFTDLLDQMQNQTIDILVGTQMVVKGLDFAPVALVGILLADGLLSFPDFRVNERAFQLMEQVSGRAGRSDGAGRVIIQAYNKDHPTIGWVQRHDGTAFYEHEIKFRELFSYPPFVRMIRIVFRHKEHAVAATAALTMADSMQKIDGIEVQGPVSGLVAKVRNQYVQEVWLKCPRIKEIIDAVKARLLHERSLLMAQRGHSALQIQFDVDPV
ncbi:MAG: primosomal protein N' [Sphingobacteriales bacterium]|nr:MAG: primosomal protein N' [Sphingobacteriales bacterium]